MTVMRTTYPVRMYAIRSDSDEAASMSFDSCSRVWTRGCWRREVGRASTPELSYGPWAPPRTIVRGGCEDTTRGEWRRHSPSSCNDEASFPKPSSCCRIGIAGLHIDGRGRADGAWSCDSRPSCGSTSASATSCIIAESLLFLLPSALPTADMQ
jgi:hypothetical protein